MHQKPPNPSPPQWLDDDWDIAAGHAPRFHPRPAPCLVFSPLAWLKLQFFLHAGDSEIGGFGISDAHDLLYIDDVLTVKQSVTPVSVQFDDHAVADLVDSCVDAGMQPRQFSRIWIHTHPGESPLPSGLDEQTFTRVFGTCDWAVMFIIGRTGNTYARLSFSAGPGGSILLPVSVDWETWPSLAIHHVETLTGLVADWIAEFAANIQRLSMGRARIPGDEPQGDEAFEPFGSFDEMSWPLEQPRHGILEREKPEVPA